jgi:ATP-dependent RNA helicase DDX56/DBP9
MSASLTTDVESLKGIFCHEPVFLNLEEEEAEDGGLSQYVVKQVPH